MKTQAPSGNFRDEEIRIREVYAKRPAASSGHYSWFDTANLLAIQERERRLLLAFKRLGLTQLDHLRLLDVGCGEGFWFQQFIHWGMCPENLFGVDLLPERVEQARYSCPAGVTVECASATNLRFPDGSFDLVLQSTLFSSVLHQPTRIQIAQEMLRVLRPQGFVLWYDFHVQNPNNPDVSGVTKKEIRRLFPGCRMQFEKLTLLPPLGRIIAPRSIVLYRLLSGMRLLSTHYLALIEKP
jgi:ubiquinone/menaquinone biosynthesis C-methylase UbiE